jgi:ATP-binding cassette subfamily C protein
MQMSSKRTLDFFRYFFNAHPLRSWTGVILLALAGVAEGFGVLTLVPMLQLMEGGSEPNAVAVFVSEVLGSLGLRPTLGSLLLVLVGMILLKSALTWLALMQVQSSQIRASRELRWKLLRALLASNWGYVGDQQPGAWANAISNEAIHSSAAYRESCEILAAIFPVLIYAGIAALISWQTTVFALVCGFLIIWLLRGFVARSRSSGREQVRHVKGLASLAVDVMQGLKPIKAMGQEALVGEVLQRRTIDLEKAELRTMHAAVGNRFFHEPAIAAALALGILILFEVIGLQLSTIIVFAFLFYRILTHLKTVQMRYQTLVVGEAAFWSLYERQMEAQREEERIIGGRPAPGLDDHLALDCVSFRYDEAQVLNRVDLHVEAGTFVAIEGESGSGKTTLADVIAGLRRPDSGRVLVDGVDMVDVDVRSWRQRVGYVPQEMLLLNDTIMMNVTLGDPQLSEEDARRALEMAGAWAFVRSRADQMAAHVGERGVKLSGGQRQRIAIARALVRKPKLLILDEVTTALDPETEAAICDTLVSLKGDLTILSISHQPAMRRAADQSFLMRRGNLAALARPIETG